MIPGAPDPVAPFSHAVEVDGWVFVTGQMPVSRTSATSAYPEGIEAQTRQVMENLKRVLGGCQLGLENVVAARVFLTRFEQDCNALARGALVEIDFIARRVQAPRGKASQ
jgi:2-iminobutanoate/2-iminopropanoate deaminase